MPLDAPGSTGWLAASLTWCLPTSSGLCGGLLGAGGLASTRKYCCR
eukprot:COSAG01_NODE_59437_length_300_cov_0.771144_1_plen_45_part_01